jgi:MoxR-like ATPase
VGQGEAFELLCVALFSGHHVLLEGVPGTAKTLMAKLLARLVDAQFHRIQFTPDLMPSDIVGTSVFDLQSGHFYLKHGPIFTQILLADEVNRAPAKTQAALLEAMEERQVTLEGEPHALPFPFFVVATQNPIEYEGTYPLPEAQLDRFLFKVLVPYPSPEAEQQVLRNYDQGFDAHFLDAPVGGPPRSQGVGSTITPGVYPDPTGAAPTVDAPIRGQPRPLGVVPAPHQVARAVLTSDDLRRAMEQIREVTVDDSILGYITAAVDATRASPDLVLGGSPRASIGLLLGAKTLAALRGRSYVTPDDVKSLATPVLRHRLILEPEAEIEGLTADRVVERILSRVPVPR